MVMGQQRHEGVGELELGNRKELEASRTAKCFCMCFPCLSLLKMPDMQLLGGYIVDHRRGKCRYADWPRLDDRVVYL
jgi:hypothetical protein